LQKRNSEVTRVNRDLESYAYSISHDLKTPLTVIRGFSQSLCDTTNSKLDPEERMFLSKILSESDRMNEIISDLLRLSKIGFQELNIENFNLSKIAVESFQNLSERHKITKYEIIIQPEMPVRADPGLMRVLLDNLIGNALKYSISSNSPRIEIGRAFEKGKVIYFIKDNGVGFDMKKADQIFEPFIRLHSSKDFAGTGVGLSIVRRIIERHNGRIWMSSEVGVGTTVFFTLGE
jgi:signal transduction histidine kinase